MSVPAFTSAVVKSARPIANNPCFAPKNPSTGKPYTVGTKYGSKRLVSMHGGVDIRPSTPGQEGEVVCAPAGGRVLFVAKGHGGYGSAYGNHLVVEHSHTHPDGKRHSYFTLYAHLRSISVKAGQRVKSGQGIGRLGKTGGVTGAHVHFALQMSQHHKRGVVDPASRVETARRRALTKGTR